MELSACCKTICSDCTVPCLYIFWGFSASCSLLRKRHPQKSSVSVFRHGKVNQLWCFRPAGCCSHFPKFIMKFVLRGPGAEALPALWVCGCSVRLCSGSHFGVHLGSSLKAAVAPGAALHQQHGKGLSAVHQVSLSWHSEEHLCPISSASPPPVALRTAIIHLTEM